MIIRTYGEKKALRDNIIVLTLTCKSAWICNESQSYGIPALGNYWRGACGMNEMDESNESVYRSLGMPGKKERMNYEW